MEEISTEKLLYHTQVLNDLHSVFTPHTGQLPIGKAIFYDNKKRLLVQCGRKFGKTEITLYCLYRWALLYPNSYCYYFSPYQDQINDLIWKNNRMPGFLPDHLMKKYKVSVNNSDKRIIFGNGSFIKCDGADNDQKARGYSATGLCVVDEVKDVSEAFFSSFEPNLAITDAPLLMIGTPPSSDEGHKFDRWMIIRDEIMSSEHGFYINRPSMTNPHINKDYFVRKEAELRAKGELWVWKKEYLAELVRGSGRSIFPMLDKEKHVKRFDDIRVMIGMSPKHFDYFAAFDPGSAKCFAVVFGCVNRYSKQVFLLDEIYATKMDETSVNNIVPKAIGIMRGIHPVMDDWHCVYDYAATWFMNEVQAQYSDELNVFPCQKDLKNKENKLSLIKDMLVKGFLILSDKCEKLYWEMEKYSTDENGKIPKEDDHAIDALRYMLNAANYHQVPADAPLPEQEIYKDIRAFRFDNDPSLKEDDLYGGVDSDLFHNGDLD